MQITVQTNYYYLVTTPAALWRQAAPPRSYQKIDRAHKITKRECLWTLKQVFHMFNRHFEQKEKHHRENCPGRSVLVTTESGQG